MINLSNLLKLYGNKKIKTKIRDKLTVTVIPGLDCNLRCKMCFNWETPRREVLSSKIWTSFIKSIEEYKPQYNSIEVSIGGGEPYLHNYVFDIIKICKKSGFHSNIATNGTLLTNSMIKESLNNGLTRITFSLDSLNEETHDRFRGIKGTYKKTMNAIVYLHKIKKFELGITTVLMRGNLDDILPLNRWIMNLDYVAHTIQAIVVPFQRPIEEEWYKKKEYVELWPEDKEKIDEIIDTLISEKDKFPDRLVNTKMQLRLFRNYFYSPDSFIKHFGCSLVNKDAITVYPDGFVYLCPFMQPIGNIKSNNLKEILNSKKMNERIQMMNMCSKNCHHLMNCYYQDESIEKTDELTTKD